MRGAGVPAMITGYYIRGSGASTDDWALVEQDERYAERVVADGLTSEQATALYWRKMAELHASPGSVAATKTRRDPAEPEPPQLSLKL
jgi:hypothetical protein